MRYPKPKNRAEAKIIEKMKADTRRIRKEVRQKIRNEANAVPLERRQIFINSLREGETFGQAMKKANIERASVAMIIYEQNLITHTFHTLREEVV